MKAYAAIWGRAFLIVAITSYNVSNISRGRIGLAFLSGGALSLVWWGNSRTAAHSDLAGAAWVYGFGAACGTVCGMALARAF